MNGLVLLTEGTSGLNQQWVTDYLSLFSSVIKSVFTEFPLNLMLIGALAAGAIGLLGRAKRAIH